ncbi:MAG: TlpA family protein disulfide reductase [Thalassotalea sp.]
MKCCSLFLLYSAVIVLAFSSVELNAKTLPFTALKKISSIKAKPTEYRSELATIALVYQPDCSWCKKQGQWLAKVQQQCANQVNLALIGNKGSKRQLKRELQHFDRRLPAYLANKAFLRSIGGVAASPTTLFFDKEGKLLAKKRGFIEPKQFINAVATISQQGCNIRAA